METVPWLLSIWRWDRESLLFTWKTTWCSQEKYYGQDPGNHIEGINQYDVVDLWWQGSLHPSMMMTHTGNGSTLQCQKVGRRKETKELVVIWAYSNQVQISVWSSNDLIITSKKVDIMSCQCVCCMFGESSGNWQIQEINFRNPTTSSITVTRCSADYSMYSTFLPSSCDLGLLFDWIH